MSNVKIPSGRLLILLLICILPVLLLQNYKFSSSGSFLFQASAVLTAVAACAVLFSAVFITRRGSRGTAIGALYVKSLTAYYFTAVICCMYFVWLIVYILLKYSDMFLKKYNSDVSLFGVSLIILLVCAYASYKGEVAVSRSALIFSVPAALGLILIFCGNIHNLRIDGGMWSFEGKASSFIEIFTEVFSASFISVICLVLKGGGRKIKPRQATSALAVFAAVFIVLLMFILFALNSYADMQEYPVFILSKSSLLGSVGGVESLYLFVATVSVFILVSLCLGCIKKTVIAVNNKSLILFLLPIGVLLFCSEYIDEIRAAAQNAIILNVFTVVTVLILLILNLSAGRVKNG